jgi:hypothetical protein
LRNLVERAFVAAGEHEIAARLGESQRNAAADAAARSGHERDLSLQAKLHSAIPLKRGCDVMVNLSHWRGRG